MTFKKPLTVDNNINHLVFANKSHHSQYAKYLSHLSYDEVLKKQETKSFWRNCLILHMASSGVPRIEISQFMGVGISRINVVVPNTKKNLFATIYICPIFKTKELKWHIEPKYLKSKKFEYSMMELCREASELVLSYDNANLRTISAGLKLSHQYWEKIQEKHSGYYLLPYSEVEVNTLN